jgi:hypothetical protein
MLDALLSWTIVTLIYQRRRSTVLIITRSYLWIAAADRRGIPNWRATIKRARLVNGVY